MKAPNQSGSIATNPSPKLNRTSPSEIASTTLPPSTSSQSGSSRNRLLWKKMAQRTAIGMVSILLNLTVLSSVGFAYRVLDLGARGPEVFELQRRLKEVGYSPGRIDGIYGEDTKAAVRQFQAANGLYVDGIYGEDTAQKLFGRDPSYGLGLIGSGLNCRIDLPRENYVVVIPGDHVGNLQGKGCLRQDSRGEFTAAAEFATYTQAQLVSNALRQSRNLDARVVYFP